MTMQNIHRKHHQRQYQTAKSNDTSQKTRHFAPGSNKRENNYNNCNQEKRDRPIQDICIIGFHVQPSFLQVAVNSLSAPLCAFRTALDAR